MTTYELFSSIKEYLNEPPEEFVLHMEEVIEKIIDNPTELATALMDELVEYKEKHDLCPNCNSKMNYKIEGIERSEYFGREVGEILGSLVCSNTICGHKEG